MTRVAAKNLDVAVIGDWHLAFVTSAVFASLGLRSALVKPLNLNSSEWTKFPAIPVQEPGLEELIQTGLAANLLSFCNGVSESLEAKYLWLAVDTPVSELDEPQIEPLLQIVEQLQSLVVKPRALFISSQVPLGFCRDLQMRLSFPVVYVPENLRLGKGIETFLAADRTVLGCDRPEFFGEAGQLFSGFKTEIVQCNLVTAEMVKHATNAFLATSISFANEIARVGQNFGVDSQLVGKALKLDLRIGKSAYVMPGLGFAGGTLPRDLRVLQKLGKREGVPTPLTDAVLQVNESTTEAIFQIIDNGVRNRGLQKNVVLLGYTYKADTDTLRRSLSVELAQKFKENAYQVFGFDPVMNGKDLSAFQENLQHVTQWSELGKAPATFVCLTGRKEFATLDWSQLTGSWKSSAEYLVFDTQAVMDAKSVLASGLSFQRLWGQPLIAEKNASTNTWAGRKS